MVVSYGFFRLKKDNLFLERFRWVFSYFSYQWIRSSSIQGPAKKCYHCYLGSSKTSFSDAANIFARFICPPFGEITHRSLEHVWQSLTIYTTNCKCPWTSPFSHIICRDLALALGCFTNWCIILYSMDIPPFGDRWISTLYIYIYTYISSIHSADG